MAKDFKISKTTGLCCACREPLSPGEELLVRARMTDEELLREDYHLRCWEAWGEEQRRDDPNVLGSWRTRVPPPEEKKKLFVDDSLLMNFFERLDGTDDEGRIRLRYVLALILMRKKLLVYEATDRRDDGTEVWKMRFKGAGQLCEVIDPHMDEEKIASVSASLGEIMEGDFG